MIHFFVPGHPKGWRRPGRKRFVRTQPGGLKKLDYPVHFDRNDPTWTEKLITAAASHPRDPLIEGPLRMILSFTLLKPRSRRKRDKYPHVKPECANLLKLIEDGLSGVIYRDDAQICRLYMDKKYGDPPGVEVRVGLLQ